MGTTELNAKHGNVIYFSDVTFRLEKEKPRKIFVMKKNQIFEFAASKRKMFEQFNNSERTNDFTYLLNFTLHTNDLNLRL